MRSDSGIRFLNSVIREAGAPPSGGHDIPFFVRKIPMDSVVTMKSVDNVATCLKDMAAGQVAEAVAEGSTRAVTLRNDIPFGHKIALCDIAKGDEVVKYAEVIGVASKAIAAGEHVHVHNVESIRARGDKSAGDAAKGGRG